MEPYFTNHFGNPGSVHYEGRLAKEAVKGARVKVARTLSVRPEEITFTSGGTEANNLAVLGIIKAHLEKGALPQSLHAITTSLEHSSVLAYFDELKKMGVKVDYVSVDEEGVVDISALTQLLNPETVLVSVHYVNGETGVVQPLRDIARTISDFKKKHRGVTPVFHCDASQAPLYFDCALEHLGVDMMTLDGHKIYGPKGVGVLAHKRFVSLSPQIVGGGQEGKLRSGTEPVPLVVGFSAALESAQARRDQHASYVKPMRDLLLKELKDTIPGLVINGSTERRSPNNINISLPGVDTEYLVIRLDSRGIAASTRSACEGEAVRSHVVFAMTQDIARSTSTLRLTLPLDISQHDVRRAARVIGEEVKILTKHV